MPAGFPAAGLPDATHAGVLDPEDIDRDVVHPPVDALAASAVTVFVGVLEHDVVRRIANALQCQAGVIRDRDRGADIPGADVQAQIAVGEIVIDESFDDLNVIVFARRLERDVAIIRRGRRCALDDVPRDLLRHVVARFRRDAATARARIAACARIAARARVATRTAVAGRTAGTPATVVAGATAHKRKHGDERCTDKEFEIHEIGSSSKVGAYLTPKTKVEK